MSIKKHFRYKQYVIDSLTRLLKKKNILSYLLNLSLNIFYFLLKHVKRCYHFLIKHKKIKFKRFLKPTVSIIIPAYNKFDYTMRCLQSIADSSDKTKFEIILLDDCSNDLTIKIKKYVKGILVVRNKKNLGYIKSCNKAASYARGKYLYFLNNDTTVSSHWLEPIVEVFALKDDAAVVGSIILDSKSHLILEGAHFIFKNYVYSFKDLDINDSRCNYLRKSDYICGCSFMTPQHFFKKIGGFSEVFDPAYCEDSDYCLRAREMGYSSYIQPKSTITHYEHVSYSKLCNDLIEKNNNILRSRHPDFFNSRIPYYPDFVDSGAKRKPIVLIVDDMLPQYDRHAGGKTIFHFIELLLSINIDVKFCTTNLGIDTNQCYSELSSMGVQCLRYEDALHFIDLHHIDYLFISRPQAAIHFMLKSIKYSGVKVFYYGHDLHSLRMLRGNSYSHNQVDEFAQKEMEKLEKMIISLVDVAFYPSVVETNYIKKNFGLNNIQTIPPYIYGSHSLPHFNFKKSKNIIFVGSGHGPNLDGLLWFLDEVLPKILAEEPTIKVYIVGDGYNQNLTSKASDNIYFVGHLTETELDKLYRQSKISIAPLRYGSGIKGKVVDALYHKTPVVSTSIGVEGIDNIDNIISVGDNADDFAKCIMRLIKNKQEWERVSDSSNKIIQQYFSTNAALKVFTKYFSNKEVVNSQ